MDGKTLREKLELPGVIGNITPTVFTKTKGIWQIETTKDQLVEAMQHVGKINEPESNYSKPPNAWSRGPPKNM
eukprot:11520619-Ditylum_brightwellii.AAC.1